MLRRIFAVLLLASLAACQTLGGSSEDRMSRSYLEQHLTIGKSTKDDVRSLFGEPGYKSESSNKEDYWSYSEDQINPDYIGQAMSFLPGLGSLGNAAADSQKRKTSRSLDFFFDSKGRVRDYSTSGSTGADR